MYIKHCGYCVRAALGVDGGSIFFGLRLLIRSRLVFSACCNVVGSQILSLSANEERETEKWRRRMKKKNENGKYEKEWKGFNGYVVKLWRRREREMVVCPSATCGLSSSYLY